MPTARWLAAGCDAQGLVFAVGGSSYKAEVPMTTNEAFDPRKGVWLTGPSIPPTDINWSVAAGGETGPGEAPSTCWPAPSRARSRTWSTS
jgi:hypothetical protein